MRIRQLHGSVIAMALAFGAAACSGDDDDAGANGDDGPGAGSGARRSGSGDPGPTQITPDGTRYFGQFPVFPGAGTSDQAEPLENGMICDSVPGDDLLIPDPIRQCFFDVNDPGNFQVAATLEQVLECAEEGDTVHIRLTFHPWFVDNTYGANQIGWTDADEPEPAPTDMAGRMPKPMGKGGKGHTFKDLVGSDHAEIIITDGNDRVVLQFKLDYVSEDSSAPSGYASLGVVGGEGKMIVGDADAIVQWMTSIDRNLNERGYASYTTDSPATDELYTPNPETPEWDYRVVYEAWIDDDVFGAAGFGGALIEFVHASPAKAQSNTITVEPGDCPPPPCVDNDPDTFCGEAGSGGGGRGGNGGSGSGGAGGAGDPCEDNDPDTVCGDAGVPTGGDPQYCADHPEDPGCMVD
jgi:hypothetical protein